MNACKIHTRFGCNHDGVPIYLLSLWMTHISNPVLSMMFLVGTHVQHRYAYIVITYIPMYVRPILCQGGSFMLGSIGIMKDYTKVVPSFAHIKYRFHLPGESTGGKIVRLRCITSLHEPECWYRLKCPRACSPTFDAHSGSGDPVGNHFGGRAV